MATLDRLASKGFVACDRSTRTNCYSALVSASEYKAQEGRSFLQRLYKNSLPDFVAALYSDQPIDKAEAEELKRYIDKLTEGQDMYKDVIGGGGG
jgi:predicted transcriptional regulator